MRGLDIRVAFALARIAAITDPHGEAMMDVIIDAECLGHAEYRRNYEVPVMFEGERDLTLAWSRGWNAAAYSEELENCPCCIAARGDPCPIHG